MRRLYVYLVSAIMALSQQISACETMKDRVSIKNLSYKVEDGSLSISYVLSNKTSRDLYVHEIERKQQEGAWPEVPFIFRNEKTGTLTVMAAAVSMPDGKLVEAPYSHPIEIVSPGEHKFILKMALPIELNEPYRKSGKVIKYSSIKRIAFKVCYISSDYAIDSIHNLGNPSEGLYIKVIEVNRSGKPAKLDDWQTCITKYLNLEK